MAEREVIDSGPGWTAYYNPSWASYTPAPTCKHIEMIETGFGPAYCRNCDAKLRRNSKLEWEVIG